jgi:hypothetical protein
MKSRRMVRKRYGARGEGCERDITLQPENVEVWADFADLGLDMRAVLKQTLNK